MKGYGTPLRKSHPAEVERYIIDKVRADIGKELLDQVKLSPLLKIDREDGDLSGNLSNAYGTVKVSVGTHDVYLPFIIQDKELLPFEVIRMGSQEAAFAPEKLRTVIRNLVQKTRDASDGDVVARDDIPFDNGFLGTIMDVRDEENMRTMNGENAWRGSSFGNVDDTRLMRRMAEVDVYDILEKVAQTVEGATFISKADFEAYLDQVEKKAAEAERPNVFDKQAAYEAEKARRESELLKGLALVNYKKHRSGNNVSIPLILTDDNAKRFETTRGRVYMKFRSMIGTRIPLSGLVVASGKKFALLKGDKPLMTFRDVDVSSFDPFEITARSFKINRLYTFEYDEETANIPFRVLASFQKNYRDRFTVGNHFQSIRESLTNGSTLFTDVLIAQEYDDVKPKHFGILLTTLVTEPKLVDRNALAAFIDEHAPSEDDNWLAKMMVATYDVPHYVLMPLHKNWIEMIQPLEGAYTTANSVVSEDVFEKEAAYGNQNIVTLRVKGMQKPRVYSVDWQFVVTNGEGAARTEKLKKSYENNLSFEAARNMLLLLGYTHNQTQQLFDMVHRSNRQASLKLPDVKKAKELSRDEIGRKQKLQRKQTVLSKTLNHQIVGNELSNLMSFGIAAALDTVGLTDQSAGIHQFMKQSGELGQALEKIAADTRSEQWLELAVLANIKHRLDKVAVAMHQGDLVTDADELFKEASVLMPKIASYAKQLAKYNRMQLALDPVHRVSPQFIKQAQDMIDVLYGYASFDKEAGIRNVFDDMTSKAQGLADAGKRKLTQIVDPYGAALSQSADETENAYQQFRQQAIQNALGTTADLSEAEKALREAHAKQREIMIEQAAHDDKIRYGSIGALSGIGLPGISAVIGYKAREAEMDGTVQ